jgi:hypothetical protein
MAVRLLAFSAGRPPLTPGRFLALISVRGRVDPRGQSAARRITSTKKKKKERDFIGNRNSDLWACSVTNNKQTNSMV